jgi:hypothetical protein
MIFFTDISLTGFWTDIIFSIILVSASINAIFSKKTEKSWLTILLRSFAVFSSIIVFGLILISLTTPLIWDTFKLKSFYYQKVDDRLFNAYFKPVGAYAGGEGNFWITESPYYFPIIEVVKYNDRAVLWNFAATEWEDKPINQEEVVESYIRDEVIAMEKTIE